MRDKGFTPPDVEVARIAAKQQGMVASTQLAAAGLTRQAVSRRVSSGRLHPRHRGVFAVGHEAPTLHGRFFAAVLAAGPGAVLSHFSAAVLWGLFRSDDRFPEVLLPATAFRSHPGIRIHRTRRLDARDVTHHEGIPVTNVARTAIDLADSLPPRQLRRLVRQALAERLLTTRELRDVVQRADGRRGASILAAILASSPAPTRSEFEDVVLDLIADGGLERPDVNQPLVLGGRRIVPDFRWSAQRLVLEADGAAWHNGKLAREDDAERQALLESHGERVLRITWDQATSRARETLERLRRAGAPVISR
jgi:very-short-patch-repair endonuclease